MLDTHILTDGESFAKLYCLNWIENFILKRGGSYVRILDLGCGTAGDFVQLLRLYPTVHYVGVEPNKHACLKAAENLKGLNYYIINARAYNIYRTVKEKFDIVVSFSALEHVYKREEFLLSAKECLKQDGYFLINYDAGHFIKERFREHMFRLIGVVLARLGNEKYYRSFVHEAEFLRLIDRTGFRICEAKFFNTYLKGFQKWLFKVSPEQRLAEYKQRCLEFECWLNQLGIEYTDSMARHFLTRNGVRWIKWTPKSGKIGSMRLCHISIQNSGGLSNEDKKVRRLGQN